MVRNFLFRNIINFCFYFFIAEIICIFDKEFTFVNNSMKQDLVAYKQNRDEMVAKEGTVYNFFKKHPESLIEWRDWFLGL